MDGSTSKNKSKKRIVKNPETFRERAQKAADGSSKPKVSHKAKSGLGKLLAKVFKPVWRLVKVIFNRQPFKFIGKILDIIGRILLPKRVRNSWQELKLVTWPNLKQSRQLTFAVIVFALAIGIAIYGLDQVIDKIFREVLLK